MKTATDNKAMENKIEETVLDLENMSPDNFSYPVIKIDSNGRILYANKASFQILRDWLCTPNDYLPEYFLRSNPGILNPDADFSLALMTKEMSLNFDVIGFKESGYIGLYGFDSLENNSSEASSAIEKELYSARCN